MTSFISFKVVQLYTFTCLLTYSLGLFCTENLRVSGKQLKKTILKVPAVHCKIVTHFPLNSNKTPLRHYSLRRHLLETSKGLGGGGGGYGISMGLEHFQKFLDKPMQRRVILEVVNIFRKFYISLEVVPIKTWVSQVICKWT